MAYGDFDSIGIVQCFFLSGSSLQECVVPGIEMAQWMTIRLIIHTKGVGLIPSDTGGTISEVNLACLKEIWGQKLKMVSTVPQMTSVLWKSLLGQSIYRPASRLVIHQGLTTYDNTQQYGMHFPKVHVVWINRHMNVLLTGALPKIGIQWQWDIVNKAFKVYVDVCFS